MTDQPTFMPEPHDPDAEGGDEFPSAWDPSDWPEMAVAPPLGAEVDVKESPPVDQSAAAEGDAYVPFAGVTPEAAGPAGLAALPASEPTAHDNHLGSYALFFGIVAVFGTSALYLWGMGLWWLNAILGGVAVYYGVRGFNAASRGRATNRAAAVVGGLAGLLAAIAAATYLVVFALLITRALS